MNTNNIKLIAFDLGYTLVFNEREEIYNAFISEKGIYHPMKDIQMAFHLTDKTFMREYPGMLGRHPKFQLPWYLGMVSYNLGEKVDLNEAAKFFVENSNRETYWHLFSYTRQVLEDLREQGYKLALLSNWDPSARTLLERLGIYDLFDTILVSSEVGIEKPNKKIFELLLSETKLKPEEIIYVGDNYYDDVKGSRKVGIETLLLNRFDRKGIEEIDDAIIIPTTEEIFKVLEAEDDQVRSFMEINK
ncbi:HAD family hydrolase [Virgibacillus kimchii]